MSVRIVEVQEVTKPIASSIRNAYIADGLAISTWPRREQPAGAGDNAVLFAVSTVLC